MHINMQGKNWENMCYKTMTKSPVPEAYQNAMSFQQFLNKKVVKETIAHEFSTQMQ